MKCLGNSDRRTSALALPFANPKCVKQFLKERLDLAIVIQRVREDVPVPVTVYTVV